MALKPADNDEFGDASFLDDFDMDAAIATAHSGTINNSVQPNPAKRAKISPDAFKSSSVERLEDSLQIFFGFSSFRPGQKAAVEAVLQGRDVAVFWATGSGKSICYQLPALHLNKVVVVVSPLISLMQDQVHKMNGLSERNLATYLGSAQADRQEEVRAMRGDYPLVYVTPEKLQSNGFLDSLAKLDLCLIAVDESHCVSNWGHDFRPEYRQAGQSLRTHPQLSLVPIMALTATAVPSIQNDIIESLRMRTPKKCLQSFDRPNLTISVVPKESSNALRSAMERLIGSMKKDPSSTIVYAPTKNQVEEISSFLQQRLQAEGSPIRVEYYHGDVTNEKRHATHINFLTGKTEVVVATIAFGMGIDKHDLRRVIHFGAPRTVEEYYQQIGRAGRDGLQAECILYTSSADFDRFHQEFYIGKLDARARQASKDSTHALKRFALDKETCRRKALLDFFGEKPSFGERCGTCDNCKARKKYGDDASRDFGPVARLILEAVSSLREPSMSTLIQVLGGTIVDGYRYERGVVPSQVKATLGEKRRNLSKKVTVDQLKEFIAALIHSQYIREFEKTALVNGYNKSWTVFALGHLGQQALEHLNRKIYLPVPESVRAAEMQEELHRQQVLQRLERSGLALDKIPQEEVEKGDGEFIRAYTKWNNSLESLRKNSKNDLLAQHEELVALVQEWRSNSAVKFHMAPAAVLPEHMMYSVAYMNATLPRGIKVDKGAILSAGVRTRDIDSLVDILNAWLDRYKPPTEEGLDSNEEIKKMILPSGFVRPQKWAYAVYKPAKKTGVATWEASYLRFIEGENPQAIAMTPASGRPIQVATVVGHIQEAICHGREVDLQRLSQFSPLPSKGQWAKLEQAESAMGMDVSGDPTTSGPHGAKFTVTDMLRPIMGDEFADKPYQERNEEEKQKFSVWCQALKWYMCFKQARIDPKFEP